MINVLSVDAMRRSDAAAIAAGTPGRELMRRAGEGIFHAVSWRGPVAVVCGKGNNGGDGFVLALYLQEAGVPCRLFLPQAQFTGDSAFWLEECGKREIPISRWDETDSFSDYPMIADCIFGTGFRGTAEGEAARMISLINGSGAFVVSADLNSGLNGDSGLADTAVRSSLTVSVGSFKPGHFLNMAKDYMKDKTNCDIGIPPVSRPYRLLEKDDLLPFFGPRNNFSNKGTYGTTVLIGGSLRYSGAIRLAASAEAAMRSGAGVVRIAVPGSLCPQIVPHILESTLFPLPETDGCSLKFDEDAFRSLLRGSRTAAFGMGLGHSEETEKALRFLLQNYEGTLLLDADGLNALASLQTDLSDCRPSALVLTPHPGEFSRLTGRSIREIQENSIRLAEEYASSRHAVVLLKGPSTVVTDGTETRIVDRGCPGMATAGSGDVLSGILAAVLARNPGDTLSAVAAGAWVNGRAGELAQLENGDISMTAGDTARMIPNVIREIRGTLS